jgi:Family of unknown function (DUF6152)
MRAIRFVAASGLVVWLGAVPLMAHHAFSGEFDAQQPMKLRGIITQMEWVNPHAWLHLDVKRPDGTIEQWQVQLGSPSGLFRRGWTRSSVLVGVEIEVSGHRARDPKLMMMNGSDARFPDGRQVFVGSPESGAPEIIEKK